MKISSKTIFDALAVILNVIGTVNVNGELVSLKQCLQFKTTGSKLDHVPEPIMPKMEGPQV